MNESISDDASRSAAVSRRKDMAQFVEFEIEDQNYAFPIGETREIVILKSITPTPQVPAFVDGVANLRGSIIPIINLRVLFGMPYRPMDDETRTIVVNVGNKIMGCTVDRVTRVLRVEKDAIARAPGNHCGRRTNLYPRLCHCERSLSDCPGCGRVAQPRTYKKYLNHQRAPQQV